jgi:rhodanese-related sulfurtransferase
MTAMPSTTPTRATPAATIAGQDDVARDRSDAVREFDAPSCQRLLSEPGTVLVDCREPDEHARERIAGSKLLPLSRLDAQQVAALGAARVVLHCRGGRRSLDAATRCAALPARGIEIVSMQGGIDAWKKAGLPTVVDAARPRMGVMQQTQAFAGIMILATVALGAFVHPAFLIVPALLGIGMIHAGVSGSCSFSILLEKMPWNRTSGTVGGGTCVGGSCGVGRKQ